MTIVDCAAALMLLIAPAARSELTVRQLSLPPVDNAAAPFRQGNVFWPIAIAPAESTVRITLQFEPALFGNLSLENFSRYLSASPFSIALPDVTVAPTSGAQNSQAVISEGDVFSSGWSKIEFTSFENGRLKGKLFIRTKQYSYWETSRRPDCNSGDVLGTCVRTAPADLLYIITFDVKI